jgi:hypothetical protein
MSTKKRWGESKSDESYRCITLTADGPSVLVTGTAMLEVLEGIIVVEGKLFRVGDAPIKLSTGRNGPAVTIHGTWHEKEDDACVRLPHLRNCQFSLSAFHNSNHQASSGPAFSVRSTNQSEQASHSLDIPADWHDAIKEVCQRAESSLQGNCPPPVAVVCGAKGSGKSSLSRLLTNHLLNSVSSVWYLDTDLGQPELSAPGLVSLTCLRNPLLGLPFTHLLPFHLLAQDPLPRSFSHYLGDISPQGNPELYCQAVKSLYLKYCQLGSRTRCLGRGLVVRPSESCH